MINIKDNTEKNIKKDFKNSMSYGDYLYLDQILSAQHRLSNHHDELLFVIIHQTSELWMKLILHEITASIQSIQENKIRKALKFLSRVSKIQEQLIQSWNVLATLTPAEYVEFRDQLGSASGFQSYQYRLIEFAFGNKNTSTLSVYQHQPELYEKLLKACKEPSIYDVSIQALAMAGLHIDQEILERNYSQSATPNNSVEEAWIKVYKNRDQYWDLYELAEKLIDLDTKHQLWRFNHLSTVERIIGNKMGTGGSAGVAYLQKAVNQHFFPELLSLRVKL
ncbi:MULTISPECIES: tryptophan 2,3-dioxygenase [Bacillus cereus group]|uniref:Tryptophan 2,3-dioxygenase n=1 Tax=Bacillus cereus TaxID=1396 RepID=A0A9W7UWG9_BACCE|nr:tryptophan 2,3-dioxygenase [Bacillus cereus]KAB2393419.1 tryptophan 2,3-dioxygenase [Bacillus cereus]KAB2408147.1 tryptophan 2,3-dioxygenase [Bacillus cereus]KAB2428828.1 tryptophan 2,3-dioxygenase [Bacillus cereus]